MKKKKESKPEEGKPEVEITLSGGKKIEVVKPSKAVKKPKAKVKAEVPEKEEIKEGNKEGIAPYPW